MADTHDSIDVPACFYLGREYDLAAKKVEPDKPVMYEARNLTTHGVIVGMTGSGKTGLSIALLEEAAIDGIPAVIIDPKGDLTNLLLQFPDYEPRRFAEWLHADDARAKNLTVEAYAKQLSERWKQGVVETGQGLDRVRELTQHTDIRLYTPGSEAGLPLSILSTFAAPKGKMALEDLTQKINATATALLGLSGISADPVQSREHVLVAQLLHHAWSNGKDLDLAGLIKEIQTPSIRTVGAYNLETFFPAKDRLKFASQLNNMLASPVFATWTHGEPLDLAGMLYRNGRPQHLIFYLAHLDDNQRMFFTTLLLEEMLSWTRRQPGTTSLRALLYFDEVFGYLPPYPANPPSKQPLLTLLKQARAFGVGVLLATQNPVDLDYKALSNAGTWFVGKLQTERDKARLLDGLESVAAEYGTLTDRGYLEKVIASLGNRIFLLHNINQSQPKLFQTRWALSFLRGPMTRDEIVRITRPIKERDHGGAVAAAKMLCNHCGAEVLPGVGNRCSACGKNPREIVGSTAPMATFATAVPVGGAPAAVAAVPLSGGAPPVLPPDIQQFYLPEKALAGEETQTDTSGILSPLARPLQWLWGGGKEPSHQESNRPQGVLEYQPRVLAVAEIRFKVNRRSGEEYTHRVRLLAPPPPVGIPVEWDKAAHFRLDPVARPENDARWAAVPESIDTGKKVKALERAFVEYLFGNLKLTLFENRDLEMQSKVGEARADFLKRCKQAADKKREEAQRLEKIKFAPKIEAAKSSTSKGRDDRIARLEGDLQAKLDEIAERNRRLADQAQEMQLKPRKADVRVTHFGMAWAPFWQPVRR